MISGLVLVLPLVLGLVALGATLALVPRRRRRISVDAHTYPELASLLRTTSAARGVGLVAGVGAAWAVASTSAAWARLGRGVMLAPLVLGIVLLVSLVAGTLLSRRGALTQQGPRRSSAVDDGPDPSPVPRRFGFTVAGLTLACLTLLAGGWAVGAADDMGRPGRALQQVSPDGMHTASTGPWPGEFYGVLAIPAVLLVTLLLLAGLTLVRRRPRDRTDEEIGRVDAVARRRESEGMLAAAGLSIAMTTTGLVVVMAPALLTVEPASLVAGQPTGVVDVAGWLTLAVGLAAVVVGIRCAVVLLVPGPSRATGRRAAAATADPRAAR